MTSTLARYLTQPNPIVQRSSRNTLRDHNRPKNNSPKTPWRTGTSGTKSENNPEVVSIAEWKEFTRNNLEKCFGGKIGKILHTEYSNLPPAADLSPLDCSISHETCLVRLITKCHMSVSNEALKRTSHELLGQTVDMISGSKALLPFQEPRRNLDPDFAGVKNQQAVFLKGRALNNILPGDAKTSWSWNSKDLPGKMVRGEERKAKLARNLGLSQLVGYCISALARYGYILTDEELFVFRVRPKEEGHVLSAPPTTRELRDLTFDFPHLDYAIIPWSKQGDKHLTINMSLWALHLFAANDGDLRYRYGRLKGDRIIPPDEQREPVIEATDSAQTSFETNEVRAAEEIDSDDDGSNEDETDNLIIQSANTSFRSFGTAASGPSTHQKKRKRDRAEEDRRQDASDTRRDTLSPQNKRNLSRSPGSGARRRRSRRT